MSSNLSCIKIFVLVKAKSSTASHMVKLIKYKKYVDGAL